MDSADVTDSLPNAAAEAKPATMLPQIALVQPAEICEAEANDIPRITAEIAAAQPAPQFGLTPNQADADLIVLLEANIFFGREKITYYQDLPWLQAASRFCVVNYEDRPAGFLPGMYTSLLVRNFDPHLHVSWPALRFYNHLVESEAYRIAEQGVPDNDDEWLYSFLGSASNPVRRVLLDNPRHEHNGGNVIEIKRWYDHTNGEKQRYVDVLKSSSFVLCPRGVAAYSHRILEALALGKVPVVIADDWVPFSIDSADYYIRIREADAPRVADILRCEYASAVPLLKQKAHAVYRRYFDVRFRHMLAFERLLRLQAEHLRHLSRDFLVRRWKSSRFWRGNGWAIDQRLHKRLRRLLFRT